MKRVILLIVILMLSGCSSEKITSDQNATYIEPWEVKPIFMYDDISTPLASDYEMNDCSSILINTSINIYDDYFYTYEKSGVRITLHNLDGFINGDGTITVIPRWTSLLNKRVFGPCSIAGNILNDDYSLNPGEEFGGIGGEYYSRFHCVSDGSIMDLIAGNSRIITREEYYDIVSNNYEMNEDSYLIMKSEKHYLEDKDSISGFVYIDNDSLKFLEKIDNSLELVTVSEDIICLKDQKDDSISEYMFYDLNENQIGASYENAYGFSEGFAAVCKDGKWGYIDKSGNLMIDYLFEKALPIHDGCAWVKYDGRVGRLKINEILQNEIVINDELLNVTSYDVVENEGQYLRVIVDRIRCREYPTVNSTHLAYAYKGDTVLVLRTIENEGYTWYQILDSSTEDGNGGLWIADKNGEWIEILE